MSRATLLPFDFTIAREFPQMPLAYRLTAETPSSAYRTAPSRWEVFTGAKPGENWNYLTTPLLGPYHAERLGMITGQALR